MSKKLSPAQRRMLSRIASHGDPWRGLMGRSAHGGAAGTLASLQRLGLVAGGAHAHGGWSLTIDGHAVHKSGRAP